MSSDGNGGSGKAAWPADAARVKAPGQEAGEKRARKEFDAAFALRDEPRVTLARASQLFREENRDLRGKIVVGAVVFVLLFVVSLCISPSLGGGFMNPADVLDAVWMHVWVPLSGLLGSPENLGYAQMLEQHPAYYQVETRFSISLVTGLCGVLLAVAGSLFQMVFKNPIAAPTMLGVSNGISLGVLLFVLQFQEAALGLDALRNAYSYAGAIIVLAVVLLLTKAICGRGRPFSVFELLLVGSIFSQVCGSIVQIVTDTAMTDDLYEVYVQVSEAMNYSVGPFSIASLVVISALTLVPVFLMRYSINTISCTDLESRLIGLDSTKLKIACITFGTLMVTVAQVNVGTVAMVSLVVPFVSRAVFGTEFKHQFWGDLVFGAILLLLCRDVVLLFPVFHMELTMGAVVSFIALPLYVWIIASKQGGWK